MKKICIVLCVLGMVTNFLIQQALGSTQLSRDIDVLPINTNASFNIKVWTDKQHVRAGELVTVHFQSSQNCYLTLVDKGTSGRETVIFPNSWSKSNHIKAGVPYSFPHRGADFKYKVSGPSGTETIMAYATIKPNNIGEALNLSRSIRQGKFKVLNADTFKDIIVQDARLSSNRSGWTTARTSFKVDMDDINNSYSPYYILSIGVSTFGLVGCENDAREFSYTMARKLKIPYSHVKTITGVEGTMAGIR